MDLLDEAKALEMAARDRALAEHFASVKEPPQWVEDGVVYCIDCGTTITPERLQAKPYAARCIDCQTIYEHKERR